MTDLRLIDYANDFTSNSGDNYISKDAALLPEFEGQRIYEAPVFGFADADDEIFESFRNPEIIGGHFMKPKQWLDGCKTVVSFFMPFTKAVIDSNGEDFDVPSYLWLHGRIEGQEFVNNLQRHLISVLSDAGFEAMSPTLDGRFRSTTETPSADLPVFSSNWSERHAAYAAGLGTFGLSRGIITEKGMAGRIGSILTTAVFPVTKRKYSGFYDYCNKCGACIKHCPVNAISIENGKEHLPCSRFVDETKEKHNPYYGCGKCQVRTPCSFGIPGKIVLR